MITDRMLLELGIDIDFAMSSCHHPLVLAIQVDPVPMWMCQSCGAVAAAPEDVLEQEQVNQFAEAFN